MGAAMQEKCPDVEREELFLACVAHKFVGPRLNSLSSPHNPILLGMRYYALYYALWGRCDDRSTSNLFYQKSRYGFTAALFILGWQCGVVVASFVA